MMADQRAGASAVAKINLMPEHPTDLQHIKFKPKMQRQFGYWRVLSFAALAILGVATLGAADSGYLPRIGPAPLRFLPMPAPAINQLALPAPAPEAAIPKVEKTAASAPATPPPAEPAAIITEAASGPTELSPPEEVVSPQMLLKYFSKSTNGPDSSAAAPMGFTPPRPVAPSASRATTSTGP